LWIYNWLIQWFGRKQVFWGRKDIDPGRDFSVVEKQIKSSRAFVALVSNNWLSATNKEGHRRIDSPEDWIRRETVLALQEEIPVIPVLVSGMKAPSAEDLPEDLQEFATLQMLSTVDMSFHDVVRESLEKVVSSSPQGLHGQPWRALFTLVTRRPTHAPGASNEEAMRLQRQAGSLLRRQIQRLQVRAAELIQDGKLERATEELNEGSELLMALLDLLPGDTTLDAQLGYLFGTTSQSFERAGHKERAAQYRNLAMSVFQRLKANPALTPGDKASAINEIGGAYYEGGDPVATLEYCRTALEIDPRYCYAWHDRFLAYAELARRLTCEMPAA
jgi:tetratricopeptide (TPR) repeat protein